MWWNKRRKSENDIQNLIRFEEKIKNDVKNQLWQEMEPRLAEFAKKEERAAKVKDACLDCAVAENFAVGIIGGFCDWCHYCL